MPFFTSKDKYRLSSLINTAFPRAPRPERLFPPKVESQTYENCSEFRAKTLFTDKEWPEIRLHPSRKIYTDKLAFSLLYLTPEGFAYFLPAFLMMGLNEECSEIEEEIDLLSTFLIDPILKSEENSFILPKLHQLTASQNHVIAQYIEALTRNNPLDYQDYQKAYSMYWQNFMPDPAPDMKP